MNKKQELQQSSKIWLDQVLQQISIGLLLAALILIDQGESIARFVTLLVCATIGLAISYISRIVSILIKPEAKDE